MKINRQKIAKEDRKLKNLITRGLLIGATATFFLIHPVYAAEQEDTTTDEIMLLEEQQNTSDVLLDSEENLDVNLLTEGESVKLEADSEVPADGEIVEPESDAEVPTDSEIVESEADAEVSADSESPNSEAIQEDSEEIIITDAVVAEPVVITDSAEDTGSTEGTEGAEGEEGEESSGDIVLEDTPDEDASMELPDGTVYIENIGVDMYGNTVLTYHNTSSGNQNHSGNAIQNAIDAAMEYALGKNWEEGEDKIITIVVENGEYVGDLQLINSMGADSFIEALLGQYGKDYTYFDEFTFVIRSSDAVDENGNLTASSAGGAKLEGNVTINNINVIFAGISMGLDYSTTVTKSDSYEYYGTQQDDVVDIYIDSVDGNVYVEVGEGDDTLVLVADQEPSVSVDVTQNIIELLTLPQNILDMLAGMAEAELQNLLTYGISPSTSPTLDSLMEGLSEDAKAVIEGQLIDLIKVELNRLENTISNTAAVLDITVKGNDGNDKLQVTVNHNNNLNLLPNNPMQGEYGIASLALQMDMGRTNVTMDGGSGNDQILVDGNWKGAYQTMLLHKAMEESVEALLKEQTAVVTLYGGDDDDTLQIHTDYAFTTVWNAEAKMDGGNGYDRTNLAGTLNDGILTEITQDEIEQIKKTVNGDTTIWTLDAIKAWSIIGGEGFYQELFWINRPFEIENVNVESFTDTFDNKYSETITWGENGFQGNKIRVDKYKDYIIEVESNNIDTIDVNVIFENPEETDFLTQLVIELGSGKTSVGAIKAAGWTVLVSGSDIVLGDVTARDLFVSAMLTDTPLVGFTPTQENNMELTVNTSNGDTTNNLDGEIPIDITNMLYSYETESYIEVNGKINADGLVVITASTTLDKGIIDLPEIVKQFIDINPSIVNYKKSLVTVKILNDITAAAIQVHAHSNIDIDMSFMDGLPISGGAADTETLLYVGGGSKSDPTTLLATKGNVWLDAASNIKFNANSRAIASLLISASVAVVGGKTEVIVTDYADITAAGDVDIAARTVTLVNTDATGAMPDNFKVDVNSGLFMAVQVNILDTKAEVSGNANVTANNGDINVRSLSRMEARLNSLSVPGLGQETAFKMLNGLKMLEYYLGVPQGSFIKSKIPAYNIFAAIFNQATGGAAEQGDLYEPAKNQFVGAFTVAYVDVENTAIIHTNGTISAPNGNVNIIAKADTIVDARADGSLYKTAALAGLISLEKQPNNAVGVGTGIVITKHKNKASYQKGTMRAKGLSVRADSYTPSILIVKSGHVPTESKLGVAGAVAVHVFSTSTEATVEADAEAELGSGSLSVIAYQDGDIKIIGDASGKRETILSSLMIGGTTSTGTLPRHGSIGFGAGIAVNVAGMDVSAEVKAPSAGKKGIYNKNGEKLSDITISAVYDGTEYVEARAGASAGVSVVPVLVLNLSGVSTYADLAASSNLLVSGDVNVHGEVTMIRTLIADAEAIGSKAGVGGSFLINIVEDTAESYLNSSVTADGDVNVTATAISRMDGKSYASSKGSQSSMTAEQLTGSDKDKYYANQQIGQSDQFANKNATNGAALSNHVNSKNTNSTKINNKIKNRQTAATAEGQIQIAAGFGLNIQENKSVAKIGDGYAIKGKNVTIETENDTDGILHVSAAAVNSEVALGVAAAVNMVTYTNQVVLGTSSIEAETLTLQSVAIELAQLKDTEYYVQELVKAITDVIGVEALLESIVHYEQNNKELPINKDDLDSQYDSLDEVLTYFDQKESNDAYEGEEDARAYVDLSADEKALVKQQLEEALVTAILGGQTADVAETAVSAIVESLSLKIREAMTLDNFLTMLITGENMFTEALAQGGLVMNSILPKAQLALAQYLNERFGGSDEMDGVGHKISTQTVSGAGASNVGIAGSAAVAIVNGNTTVEVADRDVYTADDIKVSGLINVTADTAQKIYTTATVSAHEFGVSKDKLAGFTGVGNAAGSSSKYQTSKTDKLTASGSGVGVGASAAFATVTNVVKATIGENRDITAGAVKVYANLRNDVTSIAVAGQDPIARRGSIFDDEQLAPPEVLPGQTPTTQQVVYYGTDPQQVAIDASAAIGMSNNTVIASVGKNTELVTIGENIIETDEIENDEARKVNLYIRANEYGIGYAQGSGFAAGSKAAIGATAAANIAESTVLADFAGNGTVNGDAVIKATTYNEDTAFALATTTGALVDRILQKVGKIQEWVSVGSEGAPSNTLNNMFMNQLNRILSPSLTDMSRNPASTTLLGMMGIQVPDSSKLPSGAQNASGTAGKALQVAAAVGVNMTNHKTTASITGSLKAAAVNVLATNQANYRALGSGFNVLVYDVGANFLISTGVAVNKNMNSADAIIDGTVIADGDVNAVAKTTQNMDGTYAGLLASQSLSGGFGGTALPNGATLTGTFSGIFAEAVTRAEVKDDSIIQAGGNVNVVATDLSKQAVRAGSLNLTANSALVAGASVAVIDAKNTIQALIGKSASITANDLLVQAMMLNVNEDMYVFPLDTSILFTTGSNTPEEKKGIVHINLEPGNEGFGVNLKTEDVLKLADAINYLATVNYYAEAFAGNISFGGVSLADVAGAVSYVNAANIVEAIIGEGAVLNLTGNLTVEAQADTIARVITGSMAAGVAKVGTGLSVAFFDELNQITALAGTESVESNGTINANNVLVKAKNREEVLVVNVGMAAVAGSAGLGGSVTYAGNAGTATAGIGSKYDVTAKAGVSVLAENDSDIKVITASPTIAAGVDAAVAAGGSMVIMQTSKVTRAFVGNNSNVTAETNIVVDAKTIEKILNVAASISATTGAGAAAATTDTISSTSTTRASVGDNTTLTSNNGNIQILAMADGRIYNILAAVSGSRNLAVGAVHMMAILDRTVAAEVGISSILNAPNGDVQIIAEADGFVILPAAVGALSTSVSGNGLVATVLGSDSVTATLGTFSVINAGECVTILADNIQQLYLAGVGVSAGGTTSFGGTLADLIMENEVIASTGDYASITALNRKERREDLYRGILINAVNHTTLVTANAGLAASTGQAAANGIVQNVFVNNKVHALVGKHNALNANVVRNGDGTISSGTAAAGSGEQSIVIEADDESELYVISGGIGVSASVGVGIGVQAVVFDNSVQAGIGDGSMSYAVGDIDIDALSTNKVWQINGTVTGSGKVAVDTSANVLLFENETKAYLGGKATAANIYVTADSKAEVMQILISVSGSGTATVVPMAQVVYFENVTEAYTLDHAVLTATGDVKIEALSKEDLNSDSGQAAIAGTAAVGGTVVVTITKQTTRAYTGSGNQITANNITVNAYDDYDYLIVNASVSAGAVAVGINASVNVAFNTTSAYVGDGSTLTAANDVSVTAHSDRNVKMYGVNLSAAPNVGVGLTVQVAVSGGMINQDSADEINKYIGAATINSALGYGREEDHVINTYLTAREEELAAAMTGDGVKKTDTSIGTVDANGNYDFDAQTGYYDKDKMENIEDNTDNLDKNGTNDLTFDPENNRDIENAAGLYDELPESYKQLETDNKKDTVYASIGAGSVVNAGNNILVSADDTLTVELLTGNASLGVTAVGVGMAVTVVNTEVTAAVGSDAVLHAGGDISVLANGDYVLSAIAINGAASQNIAVSGAVAAIDIYSNVEATMKGDVTGAKNLYVKATMDNEKLNAQTMAIAGSGTASIPISVSMVLMNGELEAGIGGAAISNVTNIYVTTSNHFAPTIETLTAGLSVVTVRGSLALAINRQKQYTYIDEASSVTGADLVSVTADYDSLLWPEMAGGGLGKAAVGIQALVAIDAPEILTYIGVNPSAAVGTVTNTVEADKVTVGHTIVSNIGTSGIFVNGGLVAADVSVLVAINRLTAISAIRGMNVNAKEVDVYANMDASAAAEALNGGIGGLAIGATAVVSKLEADNQALIELTNATVTAEKVTVSAGTANDLNKFVSEATGLAAGAGVYTVRINVAIADNNAVNSAKIIGNGTMTVTGDVKAQAYGEATATADMTSAAISTGDIGAQFSLALLRTQQYAIAGNGGTLTAGTLSARSELNQNTSGSTATATVTNVAGAIAGAYANIAAAINESLSEAGAGADDLTVNGAIDVQSKGKARAAATANTFTVNAVSAGAQITYAYAEATFNSRLYVGNTGTAGSVNVVTTYNTHAKGYTVPTGFGVVNIKGNAAVAKVAGGANATVDGNGTLNVAGTANVQTSGSAAAVADIPSLQSAVVSGASLGINVAVALVEQKQTADITIKNLSASSLTVHALLNGEGEVTKATVGSASGYTKAELELLKGAVNVAYARNSAVAEALISGTNVMTTGAIAVRSEGTVNASADRFGAGAAVNLINVNVIHTHAVTNGRFEAKAVFGNGTSSADSLTVETLFNSFTYAAAEAAGSAVNYASLGVNSAYAKTTHQFNAGVEVKGSLNVSKDVLVQTKGHARAEAIIRTGNFTLSAVNIAGNAATAYADAIQNVWFKVTGTANIGGNLNVKAVLETKDGKESGAHSTIEPQKNSGVSLSLINGEANVLTTESRMDTKVEVNGGTMTTVGGNLNVTTDLTTVARTTGNDAGVNVAFATVAVQVLDPYVQNALDVIFGGNIKVNGNFEVNATTDSIAQVYVKNPTTAGAISYPVMKISAQIGTKENPDRITITFSEGASIYAKGNVDILPVNKTYAGITLENTNSLSNVAGIVVDTNVLGTETNTRTEIIVGKGAVLKSEKKLTLDAKNSAQAQPRLSLTKNIGIYVNGIFRHKHVINSDITITISDGATLDAWEGMTVHGNADVYHNLTHKVENSGFVGKGNLEAELVVNRNVIINIGEDANMQLLTGDMNVLAEIGANDDIYIDIFGKSKGFIAFGEASVKTTITDNARVNVDQGAHLRVNAGEMDLTAKTGLKSFKIYSQWDANGLGADAEVYTTVTLNQTAIVRLGEKGAEKDAVLNAAFIWIHAGLGDIGIRTYTEASGDDQIGDVAALTNLQQKLDLQAQVYNVKTVAVKDVMYYVTGFLKGFNENSIRVYTKTDIGLGDSDAASAVKIYGQIKLVIDERYLRDAGATSGWGAWSIGYDNTPTADGGTYYILEAESYQGGTFVDYYKLNKNTVLQINNNLILDINMDTYDAVAPLTPDIVLDIYEKEDGSIGVNAFGYDVQGDVNGIRNIPKVWVEDGILNMEALDLTLGGSVEITIINRTGYALSTPGVVLNGDYGDEYSPVYAGGNQFRYFTTNEKDLYITRGLGNNMWTFETVEFYWLGENEGKVHLSTDVIKEEVKDLEITINADGSYTTSDDEYIVYGTSGDGEKLFNISGSDIVMNDVSFTADPIYEGGIYLSDSAAVPNVNGLEHIHYAGDRIPRNVTLTNNSNYNLVTQYIYEVLSIDILSNKGTDVTVDTIYGQEASSIKWKDGVSGNVFAAGNNYIRIGTLVIHGAKQVGTDETPLRMEIIGEDSYVDIESSESIHIKGSNIGEPTYNPATKTTTYSNKDYLKFKHLNSETVKIHVDTWFTNQKLIPVCTESDCPDITADILYIENSVHGPWSIGSSTRPILVDAGNVVFVKEDGVTGDEISILDNKDIYIQGSSDLNVDMNNIWMYDDDGETINFYAPNGSITITNNYISNQLNLIAKEDITFVNSGYTWYSDSILEASGTLHIGGDFILAGDETFAYDGSVIADGNLRFDSTQTIRVPEITVGKSVINYTGKAISVETTGDIIIGSGVQYAVAPATLTSTTGSVMLLGREWLIGVPVFAGKELYINAAEEIIIGEGNGNISAGSNLYLNAEKVTMQLTNISQGNEAWGRTNIIADTNELVIDAAYVSATVTNTGDIHFTADKTSGLVLQTEETLEMAIGFASGTLDITADTLVAENVNMTDGTWNIANEVTLNSLAVSGAAALKAPGWTIGTLNAAANMTALDMEAVTGDINIAAMNAAENSDVKLNAKNDIVLDSSIVLKNNFTANAGNDITINGDLKGTAASEAEANISITAGNNLTVTGTIEKADKENFAVTAKNITAAALASGTGNGSLVITAEEDMTFTNGINFSGNVYIENTVPFQITAGDELITPGIVIRNGQYVTITASKLDTDNLQVVSKAEITAEDLLAIDRISIGSGGNLKLTGTNTVLENSYTSLTNIERIDISVAGPIGSEAAPWYLDTYGNVEMHLDADGEIWIRPVSKNTAYDQKYILSDTTSHIGIANNAENMNVYVEKANGDVTVETSGTSPRLYVTTSNGDVNMNLTDLNIGTVNANGDVFIETLYGMDRLYRYSVNGELLTGTIKSSGDISIISQADIGAELNSNRSRQEIILEYTGSEAEDHKVYLEAETTIYVSALVGYEDVEIGGDTVDIHNMAADGALNVTSNADLLITKMTAANGTPVIRLGAANTIATDASVVVKVILNDDSARIDTAKALADILGAEIAADGSVKLTGNVTLNDVVILNLTEDIVLDLNGYTISQTGEHVLFAVEDGTLKITNGNLTSQETEYAFMWLGTDGSLTLHNVEAIGSAPVHAIGGILVLEDGVILENTDKQGPSVKFAGTNRSTGTANTSVSLNPSDGNTIVVSMQKYDTANAQFVPMHSTSDAATVKSLMEQYSRLVTDETATSGGEDDHSDKQIIVQYPDNYNSETGAIVYDGTEQTAEVWLMDETGTLVIADEAWYDITYEKWDESSSSWVPLSDGEVPTEAGTYRTVLTITEEGEAVNLKEENITQTSGIEFTIEQAQYTEEQVAAKDSVTVYVEYGTEVTIKNLFDNDKNQLFEVLPTGAEVSIDEWDINVTFNSELNTYTLHYTVADKLEDPNITVSGTIDVIVSLKLSRDSFTYAAPHENVVLPEIDNYNGAGQYLEYGMAIQGTGDVDLTVQYKLVGVDAQGNPFETDWQSDPFVVKDIGEYTIHYKIESAEGAYSGSYAFGIGRTQIGDYAEGLLDVQAQDKDGNTLEWDDVYTSSYDPGWILISKTAEKDGVYLTIETSDLMKERGWSLEYYIADGSEEPTWNVYDGSRILLKDEETLIRYRISGDDTLEEAFEQEIDIYLEPTMYYVNVVITEDGQIYIDGMKPGAEYSYTVYDETYDSDSGVRVENQVVGEDGKAWLDSSVFTNVYNYIELFARTYNTLEDGTKIPYEGFALSGQSIIPGAIADLVTGSSSTVKDDVVADAANPSGTIQMPETLPEEFKGYILMSYDEAAGIWSILGPTTADGSIDSDAVFEAMLNDTWSAEAYLDTLQDIYDANGNGLVSKHLRVMYIYDWLFEFDEYMTEEEARQYFAEELKWYMDSVNMETEGEGGSYVDLIYSVFLHEEGTENLKDLTIRIEYPDGSYEVYDDITDVPIRVYDYDGDYKLAKVVAIDADGNEFELSEDLYYIVYEALSAEEAAAFALRQAGILPKEPAYYRATIHLTDTAKEQYGLSEENFENMMLVFAIANPDEEKLEDVLEETIADKVSMQITVRKDELVYPNAAGAFDNLQDNQYVLVDNWLSGISFNEDGTYEYTYKLYTAYDGIAPVCIEGTIVLEVDVLSNDIIVDDFKEDTVTANPEKTYELVVTPVDTETGLTVEYSADGVNWQTERIPVSKPGTYVVYYRVKDYAGNVIESGQDSITITAIKPPVETEVTSPNAKPTLSTNSYEGVLGDDNSFQVEMTVTEGNKEDYKLEYSVFIPISGSGASAAGYWSEYTTTPPELVEGENIVRIRVTNISDDAAYYDEYIRMYKFTMYPEDYIVEEEPEPKPDEPEQVPEVEEVPEPDTGSGNGAVKTGDSAEILVWISMLLISSMAAGWMIWRRKMWYR